MNPMIRRMPYHRFLYMAGVIFALASPCFAGSIVYDKQTGEILAYYPNMRHTETGSDQKCACIETILNLTGDIISHYRVVSGKVVRKPELVISGDSQPLWIGVDTERIFTVRMVNPDGSPAVTLLSDVVKARMEIAIGLPAPTQSSVPAYLAYGQATFVDGSATLKIISNQVPGIVYLRVTKDGAVSVVVPVRVEPVP